MPEVGPGSAGSNPAAEPPTVEARTVEPQTIEAQTIETPAAGKPAAEARARAASAWQAFRAWRRSRPFWGGLLLLIAGLELFFSANLTLADMEVHFGQEGYLSYLLPIILLMATARSRMVTSATTPCSTAPRGARSTARQYRSARSSTCT